MPIDVQTLARELQEARIEGRTVAPITSRHPDITIENAYAIQAEGIRLREAAGEKRIGGKLGFTSRAMQIAMGVDHPNYGVLTDAMLMSESRVPLERLIHPKVEPEVAFGLNKPLSSTASAFEVLTATAWVAPCLEIVDSRFNDFVFGAFDNIADNSSAGMLILGDPRPVETMDLRLVGVVVTESGEVRFTAAGAAALGHPAAAVAWMARHYSLKAGDVVISGGLTAPIDVTPRQTITAEFDQLGTVTITTDREEI